MAQLDTLYFNLHDQEQIGLAITKLKELTGHSASKCADMIFSQSPEAKSIMWGQNGHSRNGRTEPTTI